MRTLTRVTALATPLGLLCYAAARYLDGRDGSHGPGPAWTVGHVAFLVALAGFGVLALGLRPVLARSTRRAVADPLAATAIVGVLLFCWVTLTDLVPALKAGAPLPAPLKLVGPVLFVLGVLAQLSLLAVRRPRRLPPTTPAFALLAFAAIIADLDLLVVSAGCFLAAFLPVLTGRPWRPDGAVRRRPVTRNP